MSSDPIAMCELLVGLGEVTVLAVTDTAGGLRIEVETRAVRPMCSNCEVPVVVKDRDMVELTDLPCFGKPAAHPAEPRSATLLPWGIQFAFQTKKVTPHGCHWFLLRPVRYRHFQDWSSGVVSVRLS